jgi:seryl-tRNA synthetase
MLDINLFRTDRDGKKKDGNPDAVRESQRNRFASVDIVDEIINLDELWRKSKLSSLALPDLRRIHLSDFQHSRSSLQGSTIWIKSGRSSTPPAEIRAS